VQSEVHARGLATRTENQVPLEPLRGPSKPQGTVVANCQRESALHLLRVCLDEEFDRSNSGSNTTKPTPAWLSSSKNRGRVILSMQAALGGGSAAGAAAAAAVDIALVSKLPPRTAEGAAREQATSVDIARAASLLPSLAEDVAGAHAPVHGDAAHAHAWLNCETTMGQHLPRLSLNTALDEHTMQGRPPVAHTNAVSRPHEESKSQFRSAVKALQTAFRGSSAARTGVTGGLEVVCQGSEEQHTGASGAACEPGDLGIRGTQFHEAMHALRRSLQAEQHAGEEHSKGSGRPRCLRTYAAGTTGLPISSYSVTKESTDILKDASLPQGLSESVAHERAAAARQARSRSDSPAGKELDSKAPNNIMCDDDTLVLQPPADAIAQVAVAPSALHVHVKSTCGRHAERVRDDDVTVGDGGSLKHADSSCWELAEADVAEWQADAGSLVRFEGSEQLPDWAGAKGGVDAGSLQTGLASYMGVSLANREVCVAGVKSKSAPSNEDETAGPQQTDATARESTTHGASSVQNESVGATDRSSITSSTRLPLEHVAPAEATHSHRSGAGSHRSASSSERLDFAPTQPRTPRYAFECTGVAAPRPPRLLSSRNSLPGTPSPSMPVRNRKKNATAWQSPRETPPAIVLEMVAQYNLLNGAHTAFMLRSERDVSEVDYVSHERELEAFNNTAKQAASSCGADAEGVIKRPDAAAQIMQLRVFVVEMREQLAQRKVDRKARLQPWL
jgi:hypothetical protein